MALNFSSFRFSFISFVLRSIYRKSRSYASKHIVGDHLAIMQCNVPFSIFDSMLKHSMSKSAQITRAAEHFNSLTVFYFRICRLVSSFIFRYIDTKQKHFMPFVDRVIAFGQMFFVFVGYTRFFLSLHKLRMANICVDALTQSHCVP